MSGLRQETSQHVTAGTDAYFQQSGSKKLMKPVSFPLMFLHLLQMCFTLSNTCPCPVFHYVIMYLIIPIHQYALYPKTQCSTFHLLTTCIRPQNRKALTITSVQIICYCRKAYKFSESNNKKGDKKL